MASMAQIPLAAFQVPDGKVAMTLQMHGARCMTAVIAVADLDGLLAAFEAGMQLDVADRSDWHIHVQVRELLRQNAGWDAAGDKAEMEACVAAAFWLALNHPEGGGAVRTEVAAFMRDQNRAQVTLASDERQVWSIAVLERPVIPDAAMAAFPLEAAACLVFSRGDVDQPSPVSQGH